MNTIDEVDGRRRRRKHSAEFKAKVIAACRAPGVSIAAVALANKLNANMLRNWLVGEERASAQKLIRGPAGTGAVPVPAKPENAGFIPLQVEATSRAPEPAAPADRQITIELRRIETTIKVSWPVSAAAECSAWLKDVLR